MLPRQLAALGASSVVPAGVHMPRSIVMIGHSFSQASSGVALLPSLANAALLTGPPHPPLEKVYRQANTSYRALASRHASIVMDVSAASRIRPIGCISPPDAVGRSNSMLHFVPVYWRARSNNS